MRDVDSGLDRVDRTYVVDDFLLTLRVLDWELMVF